MLTIPHTGGFGVDTVSIPGPFKTLADIRARNRGSGRHYFDRDAMRFFNSRPLRSVYGGRIFIDSVQFISGSGVAHPRTYKPVMVTDDGETHHLAIPPADWDGASKRMHEQGWRDAEFLSAESARIFVRLLLSGKEAK